MTPKVRLWLTVSFGVLSSTVGAVVHGRAASTGTRRVGEALMGVGVASLYFAAYAAVHLFGFIGPRNGFLAMSVVTVLAVTLSLRFGAAIALMGLAGGFLTPWLMQTGTIQTAPLFTYLFILYCGILILSVRRNWWSLLLGAIAATYLWTGVTLLALLEGRLPGADGLLTLILGMCGASSLALVKLTNPANDRPPDRLLIPVRLLVWGIGFAQFVAYLHITEFNPIDLSLLTVLVLGALTLAILREIDYRWAAWMALAAIGTVSLVNPSESWLQTRLWPLCMVALFAGVGHWRALVSARPLEWRILGTTALAGILPVLYANTGQPFAPMEWEARSFFLGLAVISAFLQLTGAEFFRRRGDTGETVGQFSSVAFLTLAFGLWSVVPGAYLAHALAALLLGAAGYWRIRRLEGGEWTFVPIAAAWVLTMLPLCADSLAYFFGNPFRNDLESGFRMASAWGLGLTGGGVVLAGFGKVWPPALAKVWQRTYGALLLVGTVALYQSVDSLLLPSGWTEEAVSGGLTATLALLAVGLMKRSRGRDWALHLSLGFSVLAAIRVVVLHLPGEGAAGAGFFWNGLLLQFGIPLGCAVYLALQSRKDPSHAMLRPVFQATALLLSFFWVTFLVEDFWGGSHLLPGRMDNAQLYTYSLVWLILAVIFQGLGLWRRQKVLHIGSLVLLLLAVGKAFLVDASELVGILRVLSFLGLGLVLIGIGFFYNKVVFSRERNSD